MALNVDREWANSLVGLRMKVEDRWWQGYTTTNLNPGSIVATDFENDHGAIFVFETDADAEQYHMRYDAVLKYADEEDANFYKFHLPDGLLEDPANDRVTVHGRRSRHTSRPSKRQRTNRALHNAQSDTIESATSHDASSSEEEDTSDEELDCTIYTRTEPTEWRRIAGRVVAREILPIPFTGANELFTPNATEEDVESFKDENGDIRYERVFEWMLPRFGENREITFFEFVAARMRNYMVHIQRAQEFKPKFYNPAIGLTIQADHVARFYGVHMARMLAGFPSIGCGGRVHAKRCIH
jgi:hypothetical protein